MHTRIQTSTVPGDFALSIAGPRRQHGVTLVVALLFLLIMTIFGVTAVTTSTLQQKMAANSRDQAVAFQAAESAVRAAELWLADPVWTDRIPVSPIKPVNGVWAFNAPWTSVAPDVADYDWWVGTMVTPGNGIEYGVSGTQEIAEANTDPHFVVEERAFIPDSMNIGSSYNPQAGRFYYRVTGYGVGATRNAEARLQSSFVNRYR